MVAKYNYEVGKLYDTVFYIVTRLFEDVMIERIYTKFSKTADLEYDMRFYNELKSRCPDISDDLIPFCYCNSQQISFLIQFVTDYINFDNGTLNDLRELLLDTEKSKRYFIDLYFPKLSKDDRQKLYETKDVNFINSIIVKSETVEKYQSTFLAFLLTYEIHLSKLIETVEMIYPYVDRLYKQNTALIQNIINQLGDPDAKAKEKILRYFALTEEKQIIYMFSLLNPYGVHFWRKPYHHPFRVGEKFLVTMSFEADYRHVTLESFAKMLLSPARFEIFSIFFKYKYLCAGDIIHALKLSKYTVYAHLNDMHYEKLIIHVNAGGSTLRYALNEDYLLKFSEYFNKETHRYIELKRKDDLKYYVRPRKRRKDAQD